MTRPSEDRYASDDRYARESFTFRRMKPWQVWAISAVALLALFGFVGSYYW